jgi:hypothetical protein
LAAVTLAQLPWVMSAGPAWVMAWVMLVALTSPTLALLASATMALAAA